MAYDAVRQKVVVMGGWDVGVSLEPFGDIWEWDGVDWVEVFPNDPPRARARNALVFDEARQHLMMFGGNDLSEGTEIEVTLIFEKAGEVTLTVPVVKRGGGHGHHGKHKK